MRRKVRALAENRPAVYRMLDPTGRVVYVGKAKRLRNRLLSYFRSHYPSDKAARILNAAVDIEWDNAPSEFAALLQELRQIQRYRPVFNVRMNRSRRAGFIKISAGAAPKIYVGNSPGPDGTRHYGPFTSVGRLNEGVRVLNDLLQLRDCALAMPMIFSEQGDLFGGNRRAACIRNELGTCSAPCGGLISEREYGERLGAAVSFLEARDIAPLNKVVEEMTAASARKAFERAARWRDRFDRLEWLLAAAVRARAAVSALSFVYIDPGVAGDDRAYVIRNALVRAAAPAPRSPIEREAFRAVVAQHGAAEPHHPGLSADSVDETLLLLTWFRRHPTALNRTVPLARWLEQDQPD